MTHGFVKVAAATPQVQVANPHYNIEQIEELMVRANGMGVEVLCLPELSITSYTCQDLFGQQLLIEEAETGLLRLVELSRNMEPTIIVGVPIAFKGMLFNCAAVVQGGHIHGLVPKTYIPGYKEFYEQRWFAPSSALPKDANIRICGQNVPLTPNLLFATDNYTFGIEICEDLWATIPPSSHLALQGAEIIFNLSASNDLIGKSHYLKKLIENQSARCIAGYVYASCGYGESTQDLVFGGKTIIAENGSILAEGECYSLKGQLVVSEIDVDRLKQERRVNTTFSKSVENHRAEQGYTVVELNKKSPATESFALTRPISPMPFVPQGGELNERCEEILCIQSEGLATRINHIQAKTVVVGISGGLDSTLALLVCVHAFDRLHLSRKGIVGITMPGFGTTGRTYTNAINLMKGLGVTIREISITDACETHFRDLGHDIKVHDVVYENSQARERTQILMDAANQMNGIVVGTGDLSELALGWATYNGDHMSMYAVNASIPKTLVRHLVVWVANSMEDPYVRTTLLDITATPISPELIPADEHGNIVQKTEDIVGPYELHDFFLYYTLRHGFRPSKVLYLAERAFDGSYKTEDHIVQYDKATILKWLTTFYKRFFNQQFKRSCLPDGPKVGSCSLSPRGDWRMPSDATVALWTKECEEIGLS